MQVNKYYLKPTSDVPRNSGLLVWFSQGCKSISEQDYSALI